MKVIDLYDFDENGNERYKGSEFYNENDKFVKSHGYSYLATRKVYQKLGDVMGLDREVRDE